MQLRKIPQAEAKRIRKEDRAVPATRIGETIHLHTDAWFLIGDRHAGFYSGGAWIAVIGGVGPFGPAWARFERIMLVSDRANGTEEQARAFWEHRPPYVAVGKTPQEAIDAAKRIVCQVLLDGTPPLWAICPGDSRWEEEAA